MLNKNLIDIISKYVGLYKGINFDIPFLKNKIGFSKNEINLIRLCQNANIPHIFIETHIDLCREKNEYDNLDWVALSKNTNIPFTFFEKYIDKVNWYSLSGNSSIPKHFNLIK